jgi:hypothetical protein
MYNYHVLFSVEPQLTLLVQYFLYHKLEIDCYSFSIECYFTLFHTNTQNILKRLQILYLVYIHCTVEGDI